MADTTYFPSPRLRLVAVDHNDDVSTRVRAIAPWCDTTAAVVIDAIRTHARAGARIVVDLRACPHPGTAQLAVLIACLRHTLDSEATLVVCAPRGCRDLATVCRIDRLLTWASDRGAPEDLRIPA